MAQIIKFTVLLTILVEFTCIHQSLSSQFLEFPEKVQVAHLPKAQSVFPMENGNYIKSTSKYRKLKQSLHGDHKEFCATHMIIDLLKTNVVLVFSRQDSKDLLQKALTVLPQIPKHSLVPLTEEGGKKILDPEIQIGCFTYLKNKICLGQFLIPNSEKVIPIMMHLVYETDSIIVPELKKPSGFFSAVLNHFVSKPSAHESILFRPYVNFLCAVYEKFEGTNKIKYPADEYVDDKCVLSNLPEPNLKGVAFSTHKLVNNLD